MRTIVIAIISAVIFGCSSGGQKTGEAASYTIAAASSDTLSVQEITNQDSITEHPPAPANSMLDSLRLGMSEEDVIRLAGEPTNRETIGNNPKVPMEDWWFGDNQKVRMVNHQVNVVVKDVARQKELMQQLMEAKKNKNEAEAERIMKELTKDLK